jgi:hypothetical protein
MHATEIIGIVLWKLLKKPAISNKYNEFGLEEPTGNV